MNWAARQRQDWIAETLRVFGFINACHIERKFDMHRLSCHKDIALYIKRHPGALEYHENYKCWILADGVPKRIVKLRITRPNKRGPNRH